MHIFIFAGDCIGKLQLAHVASKEGVIAVEHMFSTPPIPLDYNLMPKCVYTYPEIASIGMNNEMAKTQGINTRTYKASFNAIGKAVIDEEAKQRGFCEVVINQDNEEIIGLSMIGPHASELINEAKIITVYEWFCIRIRSNNTCTSFHI